ncbi:hypothetical protein EC912_103448 [Luteibacter rhizovicinus]|uniref:Uncharacterized protein n=1 Tax=Luteibacter rhizovicinus TaxID=242606 RepID=A0A4R3YPX4_9GAMM|nr:hypothetical protein EC912_103448 [Luteibacter rhizovicinus]
MRGEKFAYRIMRREDGINSPFFNQLTKSIEKILGRNVRQVAGIPRKGQSAMVVHT